MCQSGSQPPGPMNDTPISPAERVDDGAETGTPLPPVMRRWKSGVFRGVAAADQAAQTLDRLLNDIGPSGLVIDGLTRDNLLAIDAGELENFLGALWDLQHQAECAAEAMEAVIAAIGENDDDKGKR